MQFDKIVRELRIGLGLTQHAVADQTDANVSHSSKVENEKFYFGDNPSGKFSSTDWQKCLRETKRIRRCLLTKFW
jgi:hypothetical protein